MGKQLREQLDETTVKANHLEGLVANMEAEPGVEGKSKVEIADLKAELAASQLEVKTKVDDILGLKDLLRLEKETVQQKEIDISRLNGQVSFIEEETEQLKKSSGDVDGLQAEINGLRNKLNLVVDDLEVTREDNVKLSSELQQQQLLFNSPCYCISKPIDAQRGSDGQHWLPQGLGDSPWPPLPQRRHLLCANALLIHKF